MMLRARLDAIHTVVELETADRPARKTAQEFAALAERALGNRSFEQAWRDIVSGEMAVMVDRPDDELKAKARAIAAEVSSVLPAADAKPILELLSDAKPSSQESGNWKHAVAEAYGLYQRYVIQRMDGRERSGKRIFILAAILALLLATIYLLLWRYPDVLSACVPMKACSAATSSAEPITGNAMPLPQLFSATLLGGVGACLSGLLSLTVLGQSPGHFESFSVTAARPLVGLASGLVAALLAGSHIIAIESASTVLAIAFAFGFSERLIVGAVQKLDAGWKQAT
jgi:hypothetical protein